MERAPKLASQVYIYIYIYIYAVQYASGIRRFSVEVRVKYNSQSQHIFVNERDGLFCVLAPTMFLFAHRRNYELDENVDSSASVLLMLAL